YGAQKNALQAEAEMQLSQLDLEKRRMRGEVSKAFIEVLYWQELMENYAYLDSLYGEFSRAASRKFETGESNYLEKLTADGKRQEIGLKKSEATENHLMALDQLKLLLNWEGELTLSQEEISLDSQLPEDWSAHPGVAYYESAISQSTFQIQAEKRKMLPDINLEVFRGTNPGENAKVYPGFHAGISLPLFFGAQKASVKSSEFQQEKILLEAQHYQNQLESRAQQLQRQLDQNVRVIAYYEAEGKSLSQQILQQAQRSYQEGEIDFLQYVQLLENSRTITLQYLQSKFAYQQTILELNYLLN
ncbi:MAG: TolC family protein, partial [Algoriphagus sp.]